MAQAVTVTSPLGEGKLLFRSLTGREELGRLVEFKLEVMIPDRAIALDKIQGQNVTWSISGTNITNNKRITFVGTPEIGRMLLTKLQYTF